MWVVYKAHINAIIAQLAEHLAVNQGLSQVRALQCPLIGLSSNEKVWLFQSKKQDDFIIADVP